jgi:hypothetical protein
MEQTNVPQEEKNNTPNQQNNPPQPFLAPVNEDNGEQAEAPTYKYTYVEKHKRGKTCKWIANNIIQVFLALITLGTLAWYIHASNTQFNQTDQALNRADLANGYTKDAVELSRKALNHTMWAESVNRIRENQIDSDNRVFTILDTSARDRNTRREFRAYIGIKKIDFAPVTSTGMGVSFITTNTGKTPAYNIFGAAGYFIGSKNIDMLARAITLLDTFKLGDFMQGENIGDSISITFSNPPNFTTQDLQRIYGGIDTIFYVGGITYRDIFGGKHYTRFCYFSNKAPGGGTLGFMRYKKYNDGN